MWPNATRNIVLTVLPAPPGLTVLLVTGFGILNRATTGSYRGLVDNASNLQIPGSRRTFKRERDDEVVLRHHDWAISSQ